MNSEADPRKGKTVITYNSDAGSSSVPAVVPWKPPTHGNVKLNTDGSFVAVGEAGAGMIRRNETGAIIFSACRKLHSCQDALEAELYACKEGLSIAVQRCNSPITVEMDSINAVNLIRSKTADRSIYAHLVQEIKQLAGTVSACITRVPRSCNAASYILASYSSTINKTVT